jgi:hypothetical protein
MVGFVEIPTPSRGPRRQRSSKSRDRWSRPVSSRRETSTPRTGSRDPLQYINWANTYQFVGSHPVGMVDPQGAQSYATAQLFSQDNGFLREQTNYVRPDWGQGWGH